MYGSNQRRDRAALVALRYGRKVPVYPISTYETSGHTAILSSGQKEDIYAGFGSTDANSTDKGVVDPLSMAIIGGVAQLGTGLWKGYVDGELAKDAQAANYTAQLNQQQLEAIKSRNNLYIGIGVALFSTIALIGITKNMNKKKPKKGAK